MTDSEKLDILFKNFSHLIPKKKVNKESNEEQKDRFRMVGRAKINRANLKHS